MDKIKKTKKKTVVNCKKTIKELVKILAEYESEINRLQAMIDYDFLTGVYNRHGFSTEAEKFLKSLKNKKNKRNGMIIKDFLLIFIDLDNFKKINDVYGHQVGDKALKAYADVFKNSVRTLDIVGRWGGDEFIIGAINTKEKDAYQIINKIKKELAKIKVPGINENVKFGASFGYVSARNNHRVITNLGELVEMADEAMYQEKIKNKNSKSGVFKIKNIFNATIPKIFTKGEKNTL
ncbi:MAG: GGDEF domain-containing protein [Patescibacteria group bacterium]|nr:GGDEF domain-containing protein [Patescibacteria group bacterium]